MSGIMTEWLTFLQAILTGMVVCGTYNCLRKLRRIIPHNMLVVSIEDSFFWIWTTIYVFVQIYYTSNGSIRWCFVLGVVFGTLIFVGFQRRIGKNAKKDKNRRKY